MDKISNNLIFLLTVLAMVSGVGGAGENAPKYAYEEGSVHPYFGCESPWNRRWFIKNNDPNHSEYGRLGQRQMLDLIEGRFGEAVEYCNEVLGTHPNDSESLYNLTIARCQLNDIPGAIESLHFALDSGLPFERFLAGPRKLLKPLTDSKAFGQLAAERSIGLIHGPLLGRVTDHSAAVWIRTVHEVQWQLLASISKDMSHPVESAIVSTKAERDFTGVVELTGLLPDTVYYYDILINGEPTLKAALTSFRTYPCTGSKGRFKVAFGGGAMYIPKHEHMWDLILTHQPSAILLLGDNVYIDMPEQVGAFHQYTYYRRQSRPEFRRLIAATSVYAIWDDHDAAIDDVWMGPYRDKPSWKMDQFRVFRYNWNNPAYGDAQWPGCWFNFSIADVDFFLLDGRFYRTNPHDKNPTMLGPVQKKWLLEQLKKSSATFKVIASPVPWTFYSKGSALDTWNGFRAERNEIFSFLSENKINGVVLLSADRHRSDTWRIERENAYPLYEFESSVLTNDGFHDENPKAIFSYNRKNSFGLLEFDTTKTDPTVTYQIINIDKEVVHSFIVKRSEISHNP